VESKITKLSSEIAKLRHRVSYREQSCRQRTRCASPLPRLHCAQTVQALPPCITGHLFCPSSGAGQPTLTVENSYAAYRGGCGSPVMVLPVPPRMVTCELSRVCWLKRCQHNMQHMQITRGGKRLVKTPPPPFPPMPPRASRIISWRAVKGVAPNV